MGASDLAERKYLDAAYGDGRAAGWPAIVYIALWSTMPADDGTGGVEVAVGAYARVAVANTTANWPVAATTGGTTSKKNANAVQFPDVTVTYPTVLGWATMDALTGGNVLDYALLTTPKTPAVGTTPIFQANTLILEAA